ncbi:MAG: two-component system regulatory protein YycI [Kurthia sp.]|nr:two-component system regulatory protein YycI [Candidatus Kurthia equi]
MDWNKTKTIFIIVFSILNVFLYSVYVNNYNEDQELDIIGESSVENDLKSADITIPKLPAATDKITYISGKIKNFDQQDIIDFSENQNITIRDDTIIEGAMKKATPLKELSAKALNEFIEKEVYKGSEYKLWSIDKTKHEAIFFQVTDDQPIFYNQSASVKVYWTDKNEVTNYEQTIFGSLKPIGEKSAYIKPIQAIKAIFEKGYLKDKTDITFVELGYSTLVPLTETQVLSPTWHIRAKVPNESNKKQEVDFFVNAIDSQILEIEKNIEFESKKSAGIDYEVKETKK